MANRPSIVYTINDKVGGILSMNANLIKYRARDAFTCHVILLHNKLDAATRFGSVVDGADTQSTVEYSSHENLYSIMRRLYRKIPNGPGILVTNDSLELSTAYSHNIDRTLVHIVHDDYNLKLSLVYESIIDVFIAHSEQIYHKLRNAMPTRRNSIFHLPYGIPLSPVVRKPVRGPLRLIFVGRMVEAKGIFGLPVIDRLLANAAVPVQWTVIGSGPLRQELQERWEQPKHVRFISPRTNSEVLTLCAQHDIFVLPSSFEGFPVSLLEAMSAGLVPVISDLPSGVPEVVSSDTGFRPAIGDYSGFAEAIIRISKDRERLEVMSQACRRIIEQRFDITERVKDYHSLFARYQELRGFQQRNKAISIGSRLDQPWLPNMLVQNVRKRLSKTYSKRVGVSS